MKKLIRLIFKQNTVVPSWAGGLIIVHLEVFAILGLLTFIGVMNGVWINHPQWHIYFSGNFLLFLLCFFLPLEVVALIYYKFAVPARQKYSGHQAFTEERNPAYQKLVAIEKNQRKIMAKLGIKHD